MSSPLRLSDLSDRTRAKEKVDSPPQKSKSALNKEQLSLMRQIFDKLDSDKNFVIGRDEFVEGLDSTNATPSTFQQWLRMMFMISHRQTDMHQIFDTIDSDGSGIIQWAEFVPVVLSTVEARIVVHALYLVSRETAFVFWVPRTSSGGLTPMPTSVSRAESSSPPVAMTHASRCCCTATPARTRRR